MFEISHRKKLSDLYGITDRGGCPQITPLEPDGLIDRTGVYMIFDHRVDGARNVSGIGDLIYVGLAGANGKNSTFDDRLPKHIKKSLGFHADHADFPQPGVSDTRRWANYRDHYLSGSLRENIDSLLENWSLQFVVIPNDELSDRYLIGIMEKVVSLIYSVACLPQSAGLAQPMCNGSALTSPLLKIFDDFPGPQSDDSEPLSPTHSGASLSTGVEVLTRDNDTLDEAFFARLDADAQAIYQSYVSAVQEVFSQRKLENLNLYLHYTNTDVRDMRVAGEFPDHPMRKNCMRVIWRPRLQKFVVYSLLDSEEVTSFGRKHNVALSTSAVAGPLPTEAAVICASGDVDRFLLDMTQASAAYLANR